MKKLARLILSCLVAVNVFISTAFAWMGTIFVLIMEDICLIF